MSEKLGTEKIEKLLGSLKELVIVGKKIKEDGKVDVSDIAHVVALLPKIPTFVEDFKAVGEAFEQGKDLDVTEVIGLIQKIHAMVKEVEAA
jgi:hypothetical protein